MQCLQTVIKPPIIFLEQSGDYKFVFFKSFGDIDLYLRFGDFDKRHEDIVLTFCKEMSISTQKRNSSVIFHLDKSGGFVIAGAGKAQIDLENKILLHGGFSSAYKIYELGDMDAIAQLYPDWNFKYTTKFDEM